MPFWPPFLLFAVTIISAFPSPCYSACPSACPSEEVERQILERQILEKHLLALIDASCEIDALDQAIMLCQKGQQLYSSPHFYEKEIQVLSQKGAVKSALTAYASFSHLFPQYKHHPPLLEALAWAVLQEGHASEAIETQMLALIGAALSQDAKAEPMLLASLDSSNYTIRLVASQLAANWPDRQVKRKLLTLINRDPISLVRQTAVQALTAIQAKEAIPYLQELLQKDRGPLEEKQNGRQALAQLTDSLTLSQLQALIKDPASEVRRLAASLVSELELTSYWRELLPLLNDAQREVTLSTIQTLAYLPLTPKERELTFAALTPLTSLGDELIALHAIWYLQLFSPSPPSLTAYLQSEKPLEKILAATTLAQFHPKIAISLLLKDSKNLDPLVQINMALPLLEDESSTHQLAPIILSFVDNFPKRVAWQQVGAFRLLLESPIPYIPQILAYPDQVDQMSRLEILSQLLAQYPQALPSIKNFIRHRTSEIGGMATFLFLKGGDFHLKEEIELLLKDDDPQLQIQAALILALVRHNQSAVKILEDAYPKQNRLFKEKILTALGEIGSPSSIPLLVDALAKEPPTVRVLAAAALLQSLFH